MRDRMLPERLSADFYSFGSRQRHGYEWVALMGKAFWSGASASRHCVPPVTIDKRLAARCPDGFCSFSVGS